LYLKNSSNESGKRLKTKNAPDEVFYAVYRESGAEEPEMSILVSG